MKVRKMENSEKMEEILGTTYTQIHTLKFERAHTGVDTFPCVDTNSFSPSPSLPKANLHTGTGMGKVTAGLKPCQSPATQLIN